MAVTAVLFDIDDTLCVYRRRGPELLSLAFDAVGVEPYFTAAEYYDRYPEFADGTDSVAELRRTCFAAISEERGRDPALGRAVADAYATERDHANVDFLPGAREALAALADRYRLGIVTNGAPEMQAQKLAALGLADRFETVVHAGYDAPAKPAPEPFERALAALGVSADRTIHVGDGLETDVAGAKAAGLTAAWLSDGTDPAQDHPDPDYVFGSMHALAERPWE
jgi:putative hydrolase of the HAD superfamily